MADSPETRIFDKERTVIDRVTLGLALGLGIWGIVTGNQARIMGAALLYIIDKVGNGLIDVGADVGRKLKRDLFGSTA
jgi:hypothetical protein